MTVKKARFLQAILRGSEGASFVELALILPIFLLIFVPAVDIGRAIYVSIEVASAAQAGQRTESRIRPTCRG